MGHHRYSHEFKDEAARQVIERDHPAAEIAADQRQHSRTDIHPPLLIRHIKPLLVVGERLASLSLVETKIFEPVVDAAQATA